MTLTTEKKRRVANRWQLWVLYNKLPTPTAKDEAEVVRLRKEIVTMKRELGSISAQDEFTKWAKLRRQLDKVEAQYKKSGQSDDLLASIDHG